MAGVQQVNVQNQFALGGISFNATVLLSADLVLSATPSVQVAQPATLTTRTDNTTGTLTMTNSSHGITTGAWLDLYWAGGFRRHALVGTVAGTSVPFSVGLGTNLPVATTAIVACVPVKREFGMVLANLALVACQAFVEAQVTFMQPDDATESYSYHLVPSAAGVAAVGQWYSAYGAIPFAGTSTLYVYMSHADTTQARVIQAAALTN